jgi:hypothetical protein
MSTKIVKTTGVKKTALPSQPAKKTNCFSCFEILLILADIWFHLMINMQHIFHSTNTLKL